MTSFLIYEIFAHMNRTLKVSRSQTSPSPFAAWKKLFNCSLFHLLRDKICRFIQTTSSESVKVSPPLLSPERNTELNFSSFCASIQKHANCKWYKRKVFPFTRLRSTCRASKLEWKLRFSTNGRSLKRFLILQIWILNFIHCWGSRKLWAVTSSALAGGRGD